GLEGCELNTIPHEIARLPRLRKLELSDNPITSLPFGADSFRSVEILTIGPSDFKQSANFTANLDLSLFPRLRVIEQRYKIDEIEYRDSQELWSNAHLEIMDVSGTAMK